MTSLASDNYLYADYGPVNTYYTIWAPKNSNFSFNICQS